MIDATDGAASAEAEAITSAVEAELEKERAVAGMSEAEKTALATQIYTTWRNANLRGLNQQAFAQVEAASGALISSISASL